MDEATLIAAKDDSRDLSPRAYAIALGLLVLLTIAAFAPVFRAGLLSWDDQQTIAKNPLFDPPSFDTIAWYAQHSHMHLWVPATYAVWTVLAAISRGGDGTIAPLAFHAANLAAHLAMILLAARLLRRLDLPRSAALLGAAIVALHPMQVEAVAWASGWKDGASTLLMYAAALTWTRTPPSGRRSATATVMYVIALLTKPTAIVTPLIAAALSIARGERPGTTFKRLVPWIVLAIPVALIGRSVQPPSHGDVAALYLRPIIALDSLGWYAQKLLVPLGLTIDHGRTPTRVLAGDVSIWPSAAGLLTLVAVVVVARRLPSIRRRLSLGGTLALLTLAPVLGLVPFDFQAISGVAEHYLYPAMPGVAIVVATLLARLGTRILTPATLVFAAVAALLTFRQAKTWHDDESLFTRVLAVNPSSWGAASAFSFAALERGDLDDAERWARRTIEANERYPNGWANLASVQTRRGDKDAAIASLERARAIEPNNGVVNMNLGGLLAERGDLQRAFPLLESAADLDATNPAAHSNLATALLQLGRLREAMSHLDVALRLAPRDPAIRARRAIAYNELGRPDFAKREVDAGLAIDPASQELLSIRADLGAPGE